MGNSIPVFNDNLKWLSAPDISKRLDPKNITPISVFSGGANVEWIKEGAGGSIADNGATGNFKMGHKSIKVLSSNLVSCTIVKTISLDLSAATAIWFRFNVGQYQYINSITLYFKDAGDTVSFSYAIGDITRSAWHDAVILKSKFADNGANWAAIGLVKIVVVGSAGQDGYIYADALYGLKNIMTRAAVVPWFDDGLANAFTEAKRIMDAYGMSGQLALLTASIGAGNYLSWDQVRGMQRDAGWSVGSHTHTHTRLTDYTTAAQIDSEMITSLKSLRAQGILPSSAMAYPYNAHNTLVQDTVKRWITFARCGDATRLNLTIPIINRTSMPGFTVLDTTAVSELDAVVDDAISNTTLIIIIFHQLVTVKTLSTHWLISEFQSWIDSTAAKDIDVFSFEALAQKYGGC